MLSITTYGRCSRHCINNELNIIVDVSPTYSGCPATDVIANDIKNALLKGGFKDVKIEVL